jgi:predicted nucleic acid-binding protein
VNVVDSSAWLEYFAGGPNAADFAKAIEEPEKLVVPTLTLYEVFKRFLQQRSESDALRAVGVMQQGTLVDLTGSLSLAAAPLSLEYKLTLADAVIYATARSYQAVLWSQDAHFKGLPGVEYRKHRG